MNCNYIRRNVCNIYRPSRVLCLAGQLMAGHGVDAAGRMILLDNLHRKICWNQF